MSDETPVFPDHLTRITTLKRADNHDSRALGLRMVLKREELWKVTDICLASDREKHKKLNEKGLSLCNKSPRSHGTDKPEVHIRNLTTLVRLRTKLTSVYSRTNLLGTSHPGSQDGHARSQPVRCVLCTVRTTEGFIRAVKSEGNRLQTKQATFDDQQITSILLSDPGPSYNTFISLMI